MSGDCAQVYYIILAAPERFSCAHDNGIMCMLPSNASRNAFFLHYCASIVPYGGAMFTESRSLNYWSAVLGLMQWLSVIRPNTYTHMATPRIYKCVWTKERAVTLLYYYCRLTTLHTGISLFRHKQIFSSETGRAAHFTQQSA